MHLYKKYNHSQVCTSDILALCESICSNIEEYLSHDEYLMRQREKIAGLVKDVHMLLVRSKKNAFTETLKSIDDERDDLTSGMHSEIEGKIRLKKFAPHKGEAAEKIFEVFQSLPVDTNAGYSAESGQIRTRIRKLNTPEYREHFETLDMLKLFDYYIQLQDEFEKVTYEKDALESAKIRGTVKDQIKLIKSRISWVLPYLEAQNADLPEQYSYAANALKQTVNRIMTQIKARNTRKANAS